MKIINDSVHGPICLDRCHLLFVDTPAFQRLRDILQLGATSWVYPTASHHRFEHSLGTCHLAGKFVRQIQRSQPELGIYESDILCAELAGLLHDIGHGPFSHCWDADIIPGMDVNYPHEKASIDIIDYLLDQNGGRIRRELEGECINENEIRLVKEMIFGVLPGKQGKLYSPDNPKSFLYDVISNSFCGLDVDKLDYLARDGKALGTVALEAYDLERLMLTARVVKKETEHHLLWRDVAASSINNVFQLRHRLHTIAYQHKTVVGIQLMMKDAILEAKDYFGFSDLYKGEGENTDLDVGRFLTLTDSVFWTILNSDDEHLRKSRAVLERISTRKLYGALSSLRLEANNERTRMTTSEIEKDLLTRIERQRIPDHLKKRCKAAMIIKKCKFNYGMGSKNPLDVLPYMTQSHELIKRTANPYASNMLFPKFYAEVDIRLYSKEGGRCQEHASSCNDVLKNVFIEWSNGIPEAMPADY